MLTTLTAAESFGLVDGPSPVLVAKSRNDLPQLFADSGFSVGAEIGVWEGEFSERLCRANPRLSLFCVDSWQMYKSYNEKKNNQARLDQAYAITRARLAIFHATVMRMPSVEAADAVPDGSLDFIYIDANHMEPFVTQDLEAWVPKVRSGGIVAGHDYVIKDKQARKHLQVTQAVDAYTERHQIAPWYVLTKDKSPSFLWVKR